MSEIAGSALIALALVAGITIDLNVAAAATILAALIAAYPSSRLIAANRRKVLTEAGQVADARVLAYSDRVDRENRALRDRVSTLEGKLAANEHHSATLEGKLDATTHRCDVLERLLIEHGIPVPA
jgi:hypothetical protein